MPTQWINSKSEAEPVKIMGERLRSRRVEVGLTQEQVCERTGLGMMTLVRIERGEPGTSIANVLKAAGAVGMKLGVTWRPRRNRAP